MTPNVYGTLLMRQPKAQKKKKSKHFQIQIEDKIYADTEHSTKIAHYLNKYFSETTSEAINFEKKNYTLQN